MQTQYLYFMLFKADSNPLNRYTNYFNLNASDTACIIDLRNISRKLHFISVLQRTSPNFLWPCNSLLFIWILICRVAQPRAGRSCRIVLPRAIARTPSSFFILLDRRSLCVARNVGHVFITFYHGCGLENFVARHYWY